ncbi:MAG TPA: hypothetical protein VFQ38_08985 [Longimicrobiales bacterium]|nr:hypothetical protein [Longimicrobiales bacterium]
MTPEFRRPTRTGSFRRAAVARAGRLDAVFLRWQRSARSDAFLYRFTLATRVLLVVAFIPTGLVKLLGRRFTTMSLDYPIGAFFETLYRSGLYWHFIGAGQVVAGLCLLVPATATLGAVLFFPILLNIFVITLSYDFHFTPVVTGLMLLANLYLLGWDYDRLRPILGAPGGAVGGLAAPREHRLGRAEWATYVVGTAAAVSLHANMRLGLFPRWWSVPLLLAGAACAVVAVAYAWALCRSGRPAGRVALGEAGGSARGAG